MACLDQNFFFFFNCISSILFIPCAWKWQMFNVGYVIVWSCKNDQEFLCVDHVTWRDFRICQIVYVFHFISIISLKIGGRFWKWINVEVGRVYDFFVYSVVWMNGCV